MICPKCGKARAHRAERKTPLDHTLNWFFLKPYVCRDCSYRWHRFPSGVGGPTLRMEFEQRMHSVSRRKGWKRMMLELTFYGLAAVVLAALMYFMAKQGA